MTSTYYLACARRLAWGYVDHPPLSIAVLAVMVRLLGEGILALRLVPALCAGALVVLAADIAARLGGERFAQILAAVAMSIAGVVLVITGFYSMNALDLVFWAGAWALLAQMDGRAIAAVAHVARRPARFRADEQGRVARAGRGPGRGARAHPAAADAAHTGAVSGRRSRAADLPPAPRGGK